MTKKYIVTSSDGKIDGDQFRTRTESSEIGKVWGVNSEGKTALITTSSDSVMVDTTAHTNMMRSTLADLVSNGTSVRFTRVMFVSTESPEKDLNVYCVDVTKTADGYQQFMVAVNSYYGYVYSSILKSGSWQEWKSIANYLPKTGGVMEGSIDMGGEYPITGLGTPTDDADACTKAYADKMLPLAGGTMTGAIVASTGNIMFRSSDASSTAIFGGTTTTSGSLNAYGASHGSFPGWVAMRAKNTSNQGWLMVAPVDNAGTTTLQGIYDVLSNGTVWQNPALTFTTAESPTGNTNPYYVTMIRNSTSYGLCIAVNHYTGNMYINRKTGAGWQGWVEK